MQNGSSWTPSPPMSPPCPGVVDFVASHACTDAVVAIDAPLVVKNATGQKEGLAILQQHLRNLADGSRGLVASPKLIEVLERNPRSLGGEALKRYEDTLDAILCAYLAWHCWRWGEERNEMIGTMEHGYIVVPKATPQDMHGVRTVALRTKERRAHRAFSETHG